MASPLALIIEREYLQRVRRKSFILTTILAPLLMIALCAAPAFFMLAGGKSEKTVMVVDHTKQVAPLLADSDEIRFMPATATPDQLKDRGDNESLLIIGTQAVDNPQGNIKLYSNTDLSMMTQGYIKEQLNSAIEQIRLEQRNLQDVRKVLDEIKPDFSLQTVRMDNGEEKETSATFSYFVGLGLDMVLYMFIMIYGQMVMTSIIEEKNNRVLEVVVSSVKPFTLMFGKMAGVGLVAVTQILIWAVLLGTASAAATPFLASEAMTEMAGEPMPGEIATALAQATDFGFLVEVFVLVLLFFIGGFLFYASIYAAIGSAVSNVQDASQLSSIATIPVLVGIIGSMSAINDPSSPLAVWLSIIPFTSPMCMMARLPFSVPAWETVLSLVLLYASFVVMIWLCAKIYRVGIFMYGKKPNLVEIAKWARYK